MGWPKVITACLECLKAIVGNWWGRIKQCFYAILRRERAVRVVGKQEEVTTHQVMSQLDVIDKERVLLRQMGVEKAKIRKMLLPKVKKLDNIPKKIDRTITQLSQVPKLKRGPFSHKSHRC
jgi:hypothetical protein